MMKRAQTMRVGLIGLAVGAILVLLAPIGVLWMPGSWKRHVYHEISFQLIARRELPSSTRPEDLIQAAADYTKTHLWLLDDSKPYTGKPFDYLVEGIGWCDYATKVFCKLLAARGVHARYAFLKDAQGVSPHTVAEVYIRGKWRVVDPFFDMLYVSEAGAWPSLEELTPEFIDQLPGMAALRTTTSSWDESIMGVARRTFPLAMAPQRSDDFIADKHLFDWITDAYVDLFGSRFANWYQDRVLRQLVLRPESQESAWYHARHYHLYGRVAEAERAYRQLLAQGPPACYADRAPLFLSRLLIRQRRFADAKEILEAHLRDRPASRWPYFHLALCYEGLGDRANSLLYFQRYQELHGNKFAVEASRHLKSLRKKSI